MTETTATPCHDYGNATYALDIETGLASDRRAWLTRHRAAFGRWLRYHLGVTAQIETVRREMRAMEHYYDQEIRILREDRQRTDDLVRHLIEKQKAEQPGRRRGAA